MSPPCVNFWLFLHIQYHETNNSDTRVLPAMMKLFQCVYQRLFKVPLGGSRSWAGARWQDFVLSVHWMLENSPGGKEQMLWDLAELVEQQGMDWKSFYTSDAFPTEAVGPANMYSHGVNNGQAMKAGGVW